MFRKVPRRSSFCLYLLLYRRTGGCPSTRVLLLPLSLLLKYSNNPEYLAQMFPTTQGVASEQPRNTINVNIIMTTFRFHQRTMTIMLSMTLLISCMASVGGLSSSQNDMRLDTGVHTEEEACPPCEILFRNLEKSATTGKLSQVTRVQERGEPKSGTGVMFDWASGTLIRTCAYLQHFFGEEMSIHIQVRCQGTHHTDAYYTRVLL